MQVVLYGVETVQGIKVKLNKEKILSMIVHQLQFQLERVVYQQKYTFDPSIS